MLKFNKIRLKYLKSLYANPLYVSYFNLEGRSQCHRHLWVSNGMTHLIWPPLHGVGYTNDEPSKVASWSEILNSSSSSQPTKNIFGSVSFVFHVSKLTLRLRIKNNFKQFKNTWALFLWLIVYFFYFCWTFLFRKNGSLNWKMKTTTIYFRRPDHRNANSHSIKRQCNRSTVESHSYEAGEFMH